MTEWIKCSERLPKINQLVQIKTENDEIFSKGILIPRDTYRAECWYLTEHSDAYVGNLIASLEHFPFWCPLELTKEEDKADKEHCPRCGERNTDTIHTCTPIEKPVYDEIWIKDKPFSLKIETACEALKDLLIDKNQSYGNSFEISGDFLKLLYKEGVKPEQYQEMLTLARIFDKMKRIATDCNNGEDSYQDIAGYSVLQMVNREEK